MVNPTCRICSAVAGSRFQRGQRRYLRCRVCNAITADITAEEYAALHPTYDPGPLAELAEPAAYRTYLDVDAKKDFLRPVLAKAGGPGRLLDVGCGAGGYLMAAQELGCTAEGIEPSTDHSTIARQLGLTVHSGYFEASRFPEHSFDIVILSHVIEHIYAPRDFLESLMKVVRVGGVVVVITPNAHSLVATLSGRFWVMLKPVDHVSMLAPESFEAMHLERFGTVAFRQSEYTWEPSAALAAAGRDAARSLRERSSLGGNGTSTHGAGASAAPTGSAGRIRWRSGYAPVRAALTLAGAPLHAVAVASKRQACLIVTIQKS